MISDERLECVPSGLARRVATVLLVLGISTAPGISSSVAEDLDITVAPRKLIDETAIKIIEILGRENESEETRIAEIEKVAYDIFDFTTMSTLPNNRS